MIEGGANCPPKLGGQTVRRLSRTGRVVPEPRLLKLRFGTTPPARLAPPRRLPLLTEEGSIPRATLTPLMKAAANSVLLSERQVQDRVAELAGRISIDYAGRALTVIGILKGSFIFVADLIRRIDTSVPLELDFIAVASYGASTTSSGTVRLITDITIGIEGKDILLVEDIVDSGRTLTYVTA